MNKNSCFQYIFREPEKPLVAAFWCKYCTLQCSSKIDFDMHCSGKSHTKKLAMHGLLGTNLSGMSTPGDVTNLVNITQAPHPTTYSEKAAYR